MRFSYSAAGVLAAIPLALGQTYTSCNPTEKTCDANIGLPSSSYSVDFTQGSSSNASWSAATGTTLEYGDDGAVFTIEKKGQAPTISADFYIFFGRVEVTFKAASGTGIVSSIVLQSDDLDEIDWEFVGGDTTHVQSNFYGKGNTTSYNRVIYHEVETPQDTWHTYTVDWTSERIEYIIDGVTVRTLPYSSALTVYGKNYPQTPMQLKLGSWAGGASSSEGTVEWAGGETDFSEGPFKMYVKKVEVTNYNPACSYTYSDKTGSYESIDIATSGDSCSASDSSTTATGTTATATATKAPTSSHKVVALTNDAVAATSTVTGSAYSTNTASISALNSGLSADVNATALSTSSASATASGFSDATGGAALHCATTATLLLSAAAAALLL